jgi:hypothetical protein
VQVRESLRTKNRKVAEELRVRREFELLAQRRGGGALAVAPIRRGRLDAFFATVRGVSLGAVRTADVKRFLTGEARKGRAPATLLHSQC